MDVFEKHLPAPAASYARKLWQQFGFSFLVVKPRRTRLGDFRQFPDGNTQITVNADLNPYAFLITYVHEAAHAAVHLTHKPGRRRPQPHGRAWQTAFQRLMLPLLNETVFPASVLEPLRHYMTRPSATTYAHPQLMAALRQIDAQQTGQITLRDIGEGETFRLAKKTFIRGTLRRTRIVCREVESNKSYAILAHAWVEKL